MIKQEVNVTEVKILEDESNILVKKIKPNYKTLGPRFGKEIRKVADAIQKLDSTDIRKIDARWYPMKINYKDMLKDGKGTDFVILDISFDSKIPMEYFSKNILKK